MTEEKKPDMPRRTPPPLPPNRAPSRPSSGRPPASRPMLPKPPQQMRPPLLAVSAPGPVATPPDPVNEQLSSEIDDMRRQMDSQIIELQKQLQEEREKLLLQTVRAKEEEAMASKVEESLKDIQDRLRREKREQELLEQLSKADAHVKELEQRVTNERQTWVETLKTQLSQREGQEKELENHFDLKLKELEKRWHEEKLGWSHAIKSKEEEIIKLKREFGSAVAAERDGAEKNIGHLESERESLKRELKDTQAARQEERANLLTRLEARDREYLSVKAQQAMVVTQMRQEKEKMEQLHHLLEKMRAEKNNAATQIEAKDKEFFLLKTQFALYQTRAKTETEKLLKELVLYKEQMQNERQQWEMNIKSKGDELNILTRMAQQRETELKQLLDKKEIESNTLAGRYEERMRSHKTEFENALGLKNAEYKAAIQQAGDAIKAKESELKAREMQLSQIIDGKNKELDGWAAKERDWSITEVRFEQKVRELEEKISAGVQAQSLERERAAQKETALNAVIAQRESGLKDLQTRILEQEQLYKEKQGRSDALLAENDKKINDVSAELAQVQRENNSKESAYAVEKERTVQKENELAKAQALIHEQERLHRQACERMEAQRAEINKRLEETAGELAQARRETAAKENVTAMERVRYDADTARLGGIISSFDGKEKIYISEQARASDELRKLEEKLRMTESENRHAAGGLELKDREINGLKEQFEQQRKELMSRVEAAERDLKNTAALKEADVSAVRKMLDEEKRASEILKQSFQSELNRLANDARERSFETERIKNEMLLKERDVQIEAARKESAYESRLAESGEKNRVLENELRLKDHQFLKEIALKETEWRAKEGELLKETASKARLAAELKAREESLAREMGNMSVEHRDAQAKLRSAIEKIEDEARGGRQELAKRLREKDEELNNLMLSKQLSERQIKAALEQKYSMGMERFAAEKIELERVLSEQSGFNALARQELLAVRNESAQEIAQFAQNLKDKDVCLDNARKEINELKKQMSQELNAAEESRGLLNDELEKLKLQYELRRNELRKMVEKSSPTHWQPEPEPEPSFVIPVPSAARFNREDDGRNEMRSFIGRLWRYLNEPVYEKNLKDDKSADGE